MHEQWGGKGGLLTKRSQYEKGSAIAGVELGGKRVQKQLVPGETVKRTQRDFGVVRSMVIPDLITRLTTLSGLWWMA